MPEQNKTDIEEKLRILRIRHAVELLHCTAEALAAPGLLGHWNTEVRAGNHCVPACLHSDADICGSGADQCASWDTQCADIRSAELMPT